MIHIFLWQFFYFLAINIFTYMLHIFMGNEHILLLQYYYITLHWQHYYIILSHLVPHRLRQNISFDQKRFGHNEGAVIYLLIYKFVYLFIYFHPVQSVIFNSRFMTGLHSYNQLPSNVAALKLFQFKTEGKVKDNCKFWTEKT